MSWLQGYMPLIVVQHSLTFGLRRDEMTLLNKTIAYTFSWRHTLWVAAIIGLAIAALLVLLQPFDTYASEFRYKELKLAGYGLCFAIPLLMFHGMENQWYLKQGKRWFLWNEIVFMTAITSISFSLCFFYHARVINTEEVVYSDEFLSFIWNYCFPFLPIVIPIAVALRAQWGRIELPILEDASRRMLTIKGTGKGEELLIASTDFYFARSNQNYVDIVYASLSGIEQKVFRTTLSNIMVQIPEAWQVHRSYLVNLEHLDAMQGNARKRFMSLKGTEHLIPVSQKYYHALEERLSNSSQKAQERP